ncbi:YqeY-like protein [Clostridiales bacterium oral taxon 876 str. F0540]|nr:YqeY-like protein [Clostridiales bacterium oral taxon 876 str. F0540]
MSLKERLQEDWKQALKARDKFRADTISMAKAAVLQVEKTDGISLDDDAVIEVLAREVKQRREAILEFEKGNRQDLVDKANAEIEILFEYLPQQLTEEEILVFVQDAAVEVGANSIKDMGKVMQVLAPRVKGRADGKLVSQIVREHLNK